MYDSRGNHMCLYMAAICYLDFNTHYWINYCVQERRTLFYFSKDILHALLILISPQLSFMIGSVLSISFSQYGDMYPPNHFSLSLQPSILGLLNSLFSPLCPSLVQPPIRIIQCVSVLSVYVFSLSFHYVFSLVSLVLCQFVDFMIHWLTGGHLCPAKHAHRNCDATSCTSPLHHSQHTSVWLDHQFVWSVWNPSWLQVRCYRNMAVEHNTPNWMFLSCHCLGLCTCKTIGVKTLNLNIVNLVTIEHHFMFVYCHKQFKQWLVLYCCYA